jgi:DeoR family transcriptional regulator of aga operon
VSSGDCVYLDAGSTALAVADALLDRHELHDVIVVTSSLALALALEPAIPRFEVIVTGGTLRPLQHSLVNPFAASMLASLRFDVAFIGCNGIHPTDGVTNVNLPEAEIKTLAVRATRRAVLIADGGKLGRTEVAVIGELGDFAMLVTAGPVADGLVEALRSTGLEVVTAP